MRWAWRTVDSRWAITIVVRPADTRASERWMAASVSLSTADVASSSIEDRGVAQDGPGDGEALALAARELLAALAHDGVVAVGQGAR